MDTEQPINIYPIELILAVGLIGIVVVYALFSQIWYDDGLITSVFSWSRLLTVIAAAVVGFVIGWMTFPRLPLLGSKDD